MQPKDIHGRRILLSPLNWGLGHVSRCIPLINELLSLENTVIVAGDKDQQAVFRQYFPDLKYIDHEGYPFNFKGEGRFESDLLRQFGKLKMRLRQESVQAEKYVEEHDVDIVISDHRYGFRSPKAYNILLTHQLNLPLKWYESWVQNWHYRLIREFHEIWVPDHEDSPLSGKLSHNSKQFNVTYIGNLSRFSLYPCDEEKEIPVVAIISGPNVYGKQLLQEIINNDNEIIVIAPRGVLKELNLSEKRFVASDDWKSCDALIRKAERIISRSGYSTLMDIKHLGANCELIPTPGQREQIYLKQLWDENAVCLSTSQVTNKQ